MTNPNLTEIVNFLDNYLDPERIEDVSANGLQVGKEHPVEKAAFAVDASMDSLIGAKQANADMLIVHHGIVWGGIKNITGNLYERIKFMMDNEIALYASHLPLDRHPVCGNNIQIIKLLGIHENVSEFGKYHGNFIGYLGEYDKPKNLQEITGEIEEKLNTQCITLKFGGDKIKKVAVVSGGAASIVSEAIEKQIDLYITGEVKHDIYHLVKESGINVIAAGHYATETTGVRALMEVIKEKFNIDVEFLNIPTGL